MECKAVKVLQFVFMINLRSMWMYQSIFPFRITKQYSVASADNSKISTTILVLRLLCAIGIWFLFSSTPVPTKAYFVRPISPSARASFKFQKPHQRQKLRKLQSILSSCPLVPWGLLQQRRTPLPHRWCGAKLVSILLLSPICEQRIAR